MGTPAAFAQSPPASALPVPPLPAHELGLTAAAFRDPGRWPAPPRYTICVTASASRQSTSSTTSSPLWPRRRHSRPKFASRSSQVRQRRMTCTTARPCYPPGQSIRRLVGGGRRAPSSLVRTIRCMTGRTQRTQSLNGSTNARRRRGTRRLRTSSSEWRTSK